MSKNTNLSFLTDYITADITNGRIGINTPSPTVAFDVSGATKITGVLTLTSTISNGTYAYTLPSATGTLALTSALSGYLPLTGGTLTGALGGTSATFSSTINAGGAIKTSGQNLINEASVLKFSQESSTISQIASYGATTGTAGILNIKLKSSDASVDINALSFASTGAATFSSSVSITDTASFGGQAKLFSRITADATTVGKIADSGFHVWNTTNVGSLSQITFGYTNGSTTNASVYLGLITINGVGTGYGDFVLGTAPSANAQCVERLRIASTGAATFSSSVTAGDIFSTDGTRINFFGVGTGANIGYVGTTTNHGLGFLTNNTEKGRITSGGNFLLGTSSDNGERLYVSGAIRATGTITANSDLTLKKNILKIENALEKVEQINGYTYEFKEDDSKRHAGLIAQEVEIVLPEIVNAGADKIKGIEYGNISALLVEAIKELSTEINIIKKQINL